MDKLEHLRLMRRDCLKAIHEILAGGQSVEIEGMRLTRADLAKVRGMLNDIDNEIAGLERRRASGGRSRIRIVVPV